MKILILFDSYFGNTEKIARAIADTLSSAHSVQTARISEFDWNKISIPDLLIIGSPTRGFRPSDATKSFLQKIPAKSLSGVKVVAFDTRISLPQIKSKTLRFIVHSGGYAAKHIQKSLQKKGGTPILPPEGFLVLGDKGPLVNGELERASEWALKL